MIIEEHQNQKTEQPKGEDTQQQQQQEKKLLDTILQKAKGRARRN